MAVVIGLQVTATTCLPLTGASRMGTVLTMTALGLGFGVASLVRPQLLANRYGTTAYASITGMVSTPVALAKAGVPLTVAVLLGPFKLDRC